MGFVSPFKIIDTLRGCRPIQNNSTLPIPRLSKAGMPSRSEGWGGLFKVPRSGSLQISARSALLVTFPQFAIFTSWWW
jgi:hypothetical protein